MLTDAQKNRVMFYLRYPLVSMGANAGMYWNSLQQQMFPLYAALNHLEPGAETTVIELLAALDATQTQILAAQGRLKVAGVGDILMNGRETQQLREAKRDWVSQLSGLIGVPVNPAAVESGGIVIQRTS